MQNHFDLFQLPPCFAVDLDALQAAYRDIQNRVHPDKFVQATEAEKRVAMQWAVRTNEAFQTLKDPLKRASYLCQLNGIDVQADPGAGVPREFLMQQMEWREALALAKAAQDITALETLDAQLQRTRTAEIAQLGQMLDLRDFAGAAHGVRRLMFLDKFAEEVSRAFDQVAG